MEGSRVYVYVISLGHVELHDSFVLAPEQILDVLHFLPRRRAVWQGN